MILAIIPIILLTYFLLPPLISSDPTLLHKIIPYFILLTLYIKFQFLIKKSLFKRENKIEIEWIKDDHFIHIYSYYYRKIKPFIKTKLLYLAISDNLSDIIFCKENLFKISYISNLLIILSASLSIIDTFNKAPILSTIRFWPEILTMPFLILFLLSDLKQNLFSNFYPKIFLIILIIILFIILIFETYIYIRLIKQLLITHKLVAIYSITINLPLPLKKFLTSNYQYNINTIFVWKTIFPFLSLFNG